MPQIPILIYTDAPDHWTGLGRISRDLSFHIYNHLSDTFRVATLGVYGRGSRRFPWPQYTAQGPDDALFNLQRTTDDFFGTERGILLTITPPSWLLTLCMPEFVERDDPSWKQYSQWVQSKPFEHWAYVAIESVGPHNRFPIVVSEILKRPDRVLYYSHWGATTACNSGVSERARYIHHGIDCGTWMPAPPSETKAVRLSMGAGPNDCLVGCVARNDRRKFLPLLFESLYHLRHKLGSSRLKVWLHTDEMIREFNITELAESFGFRFDSDLFVTSSKVARPDSWLRDRYSSCDFTVLPTGGEGFGYTVIESLSCGTPCVTGEFGAQSEFLTDFRPTWLCPVKATHIISSNTLVEPIYDPSEFSSRMLMAWTEVRQDGPTVRAACRAHAISRWEWSHLWPEWEKWFLYGHFVMTQPKETLNANPDTPTHPALPDAPPAGDSLGLESPVGGDDLATGQRAPDADSGGPRSTIQVRLGGEADRAATAGAIREGS